MKRGKPLERRTPLRARPPARDAEPRRAGPERKSSPRRKPRKPWRPPPAALADYQRQRRRLYELQGGRCAGCAHPADIGNLDLSHKKRLGTRASRWDRDHELNTDENCEMLCRRCHHEHEATERAEHAEWMRQATGGEA